MLTYNLIFAFIIWLCFTDIASTEILNEDEILWEKCYSGAASPFDCNKIDCSNINDPELRALCASTFGEVVNQDLQALDFEKRDTPFLKATSSSISPQLLHESVPVSIALSPGERFQYQFQINMSDPSAQQYYEIMVFMSANLCNYPPGLSDPNSYLNLYYTFNDTEIFTNNSDLSHYQELYSKEEFEYGYLQALADTDVKTNDSFFLNLVLEAEETKDANGTFTIELGISQENLLFQWDNKTWVSLVDTDDTSALFMTGNLTTSYSNASDIVESSSNLYTIHIFHDEESNYFTSLNRSWCSIVNADELVPQSNITYSFTQRGGGLKEQIYVRGLEPATSYVAYVTQDFFHKDNGGVVFDRLFFTTEEPDTCQLIFNLTFCENVAYSVPRSANVEIDTSFENLAKLYDTYAESIYENFTKALQQIPCDAEDDQRYSPIVTCDDCATSYKNWLCAVTIPRCTTNEETEYRHRPLNNSRNDYINEKVDPPSPYYEILPCIDMCHAIVRDCPSDFNFGCPEDNVSITKSYWFTSDDTSYDTCNYVGAIATTSDTIASLVLNKTVLFMSLIFVSFVLF